MALGLPVQLKAADGSSQATVLPLPAANVTASAHVPAANTQATISHAAGGAGVKRVCTSLSCVLAANTTAPSAAAVSVALRDGASGAGTVLWSHTMVLSAVAGAMNGIALADLWIPGTANTAMTLEFSGAAGANTFESVSLVTAVVTG